MIFNNCKRSSFNYSAILEVFTHRVSRIVANLILFSWFNHSSKIDQSTIPIIELIIHMTIELF